MTVQFFFLKVFFPFPSVITCSQPSTITNGRFTPLESYKYGQAVTYSCDKGYQLNGVSTIQCTEDGIFHPSPPQCEGKSLRKYQRYDYVALRCYVVQQSLSHDYLLWLDRLCPVIFTAMKFDL